MLDLLLHNFWLKLLALGLGCLVWLHVATEKLYRFEARLPVNSLSLRDPYTISSQVPDSITVLLEASGKQYVRQKWRTGGLRISAMSMTSGLYLVPLSSANTFLEPMQPDFRLADVVAPQEIELRVEPQAEKIVPIRAIFAGRADNGFMIGDPVVVRPDSVLIRGPRSLIDTLTSIETEPIDLRGLRNSATVRGQIRKPLSSVRMVRDSVSATVPIIASSVRTFASIPIRLFHAPAGKNGSFSPQHVTVQVEGPAALVDSLVAAQISVTADARTADSIGRVSLLIEVPRPARIVGSSASSIWLDKR